MRGLRRRSAAARLLRSWVQIPPGAWMFVCCECCMLSCRGLCDELITRPEESYRLWCVVMCDLETSRMRRPWPSLGRSTTENKQANGSVEVSVAVVTTAVAVPETLVFGYSTLDGILAVIVGREEKKPN